MDLYALFLCLFQLLSLVFLLGVYCPHSNTYEYDPNAQPLLLVVTKSYMIAECFVQKNLPFQLPGHFQFGDGK